MVNVQIGSLLLDVSAGIADEQRVAPSDRWRVILTRSSPTAPGLDPTQVDRLLHGLEHSMDDDGYLRRSALHDVARSAELDVAYFVVMVWGLGKSGLFNRLSYRVRQALHGEHEALSASREAAASGVDLAGLWEAHFLNRPPKGLGQTSFGSKWLYAVGYGQLGGGAQPLVYDLNVYAALTEHAGLSDFRPPDRRNRRSWMQWCQLAAQVAQQVGGGVQAADIEKAMFDRGRRSS